MKSGLVREVDRLIETQAASWPLLTRGMEGLRLSQTRGEQVAHRELIVRHIPHRIASTTAAVDAASVSRRPCFLCAANLPPEEKGIPFDGEFTIYCNPFPILDRHLTIVHNEHRLQRIAGSIGAMLRFAEALPEFFIIYNGPECGASAPDHLHFQACSRNVFPIEQDAEGVEGFIPNYARNVFVYRDSDLSRLEGQIERVIGVLSEIAPRSSEPMLNIATFYSQERWTALVFPRGKHRPRVYETGELTVSPATIDLCGILVVPILKDYERIHGADIEHIFEEVTLPAEAFERAMKQLENRQ
jgi:hypothetical protein